MSMKAQTKRWVFAVSVAGSLLSILFYLDRSAPLVQVTQGLSSGHSLAANSGDAATLGRAASQPPR
jgi:hypothetical protein